MSSGIVSALDLGSTKITCLQAELVNDEVKVLSVAVEECKGVRKGVISDAEATLVAVDNVTRRAEGQSGNPIKDVIVNVSGSHLEGVDVQGFVPIYPQTRQITREDVLAVLNHSRQHILPLDREQLQALPREFKIDGQGGIKRPIGMTGGRLEVSSYLVTAQVGQLQKIEKVVKQANRHVAQMVYGPLASGLGALTSDEIQNGAICIDIGGGVTDLAQFSGGSLIFGTSVAVGGSLVTSDLSNLLRTSPEEAGRLKRTHGAALAAFAKDNDSIDVMQIGQTSPRPMQRRVLCEIIESRMREVATILKQKLEAKSAGSISTGSIVLTGGGSLLPGTAELFADVFGVDSVRIGLPSVVVPPGDTNASKTSALTLAAAIGLAKFGLESYEDELAPAVASEDWKAKVRSLWSLFGSK